jgi:hypothetical protein
VARAAQLLLDRLGNPGAQRGHRAARAAEAELALPRPGDAGQHAQRAVTRAAQLLLDRLGEPSAHDE